MTHVIFLFPSQIAIMGCIVNGPGEMADADFGYVGGAPGKIDLYVGKVPSFISLISLLSKMDPACTIRYIVS